MTFFRAGCSIKHSLPSKRIITSLYNKIFIVLLGKYGVEFFFYGIMIRLFITSIVLIKRCNFRELIKAFSIHDDVKL
jgi:hypothetical protein